MIVNNSTPPKSVIGLLRHGTTKWNEEKRIQGHGDSPLTPKGRQKTVAWSHFLIKFHWDRILASDLARVKETVSILNHVLDLPVFWDERLKEQYWGDWEGMTLADIENQSPDFVRQQVQAGWNFTPPQGESRQSVKQRAITALVDATKKWPGDNILVVCHQGVMKCLLYHIAERSFLPEDAKMLHKDRLQTITCADGTFKILQLNITPDTL